VTARRRRRDVDRAAGIDRRQLRRAQVEAVRMPGVRRRGVVHRARGRQLRAEYRDVVRMAGNRIARRIEVRTRRVRTGAVVAAADRLQNHRHGDERATDPDQELASIHGRPP